LAGSRYDGTVRSSMGSVVQFLYGEDGMDAVRIEEQFMEHLKLDAYKLEDKFKYHVDAVVVRGPPVAAAIYSFLFRVLRLQV
jgi:hypothetical protein